MSRTAQGSAQASALRLFCALLLTRPLLTLPSHFCVLLFPSSLIVVLRPPSHGHACEHCFRCTCYWVLVSLATFLYHDMHISNEVTSVGGLFLMLLANWMEIRFIIFFRVWPFWARANIDIGAGAGVFASDVMTSNFQA